MQFVSLRVIKYFPEEETWFWGEVTKYLHPTEPDEVPLWHVTYDDGDAEDMEESEVIEANYDILFENDPRESFNPKPLIKRGSTISYEIIKGLTGAAAFPINNPTFTAADRIKKCQIFGIPDTATSFISKTAAKGTGDHPFEIRGYYKKTGLYGVDDEWNTAPCTHAENKSWKKFIVWDGTTTWSRGGTKHKRGDPKLVKKDVGHESLTEANLNYLKTKADSESNKSSPKSATQQLLHYKMLVQWKDYCRSRGARLSFSPTCDQIQEIEEMMEGWQEFIVKVIGIHARHNQPRRLGSQT